MGKAKTIEIDGRTGEGGGQLVRVAVALASVTSQAVKIIHVRGNRPTRSGGKGGGLKAQHVTAIRWLAEATEADVEGLEVGSSTLVFIPRIPPANALDGKSRSIKIAADTGAASTLLILQAILPFLLYAAESEDEPAPVELEITGGTNVGMSLSYEYLDQVLLPRLQDVFGITIERNLKKRGWSLGPQSRGAICLTIHPLKQGQRLQPLPSPEHDFEVRHVDVSMIVPSHMHSDLQNALTKEITAHVPTAEVTFKIVEDSGHDARIYVLLVARSATGLRWGRDILMSTPKKGKQKESIASLVSRRVVRDLAKELSVKGSVCDEFLQDQLVIFQALAGGRTSFPRSPVAEGADAETLQQNVAEPDLGERMRRDRTEKPFGQGSMHSQTARWVASEILPGLKWYNKGEICEGVGTSFS
ncbi:RNA 3'-terminal phosphate cyclase [Colletotrichum gloeosporioides]|uniref:RNA 3'-terminal phosphate cyclase n=1 Tax=Colletotrichum gloeosporioides TaxID=474922 RepID=A0A8H4CPA3_COLGL|nr:RNA 3'-terminal phosphate cyclase [Colletotrichum gloeosporioides]KAF3807342.1 RNA 3'-terminal phosphate cyclase [Colletotrichum gloeosporioides]